jgi:hypothetical protein
LYQVDCGRRGRANMYRVHGEVKFLQEKHLGFTHPDNTVIALRSTMNQLMTCFTTTNADHSLQLVRRLAGLIQFHWDETGAPHQPDARKESHEFGKWLLELDRAISKAQEMAFRGAIGDVQSQFMTIMAVSLGMMSDFGCMEREGYEDGVG